MRKLLLTLISLFSFAIAIAQQVTHTIQRGETLESIAKKYNVSVNALKRANPDAEELTYVGMKLVIPKDGITPKETVTNKENNDDVIFTPKVVDNSPNYDSDEDEFSGTANSLHFKFRLSAFFFKTEKQGGMKKEYGYTSTYSTSTGTEAAIGAAYYFVDNIYASAMLGYLQTSASTSITQIGSYNKTEVVSHNIEMPIELGLDLPITKWLGITLEAGPTLSYAIDGYTKMDKEKISFSKMEDEYNMKIDRFGAFLKLGGGLNIAGYRLQFVYGIPLTKTAGAEKKNFWGITLGAIL